MNEKKPRRRGQCDYAPRPCPWVSCRQHLYMDVFKVKDRYDGPEEMPAGGSCALDLADLGGMTLEEVGAHLNVSRERIRQIEENALRKMRHKK